MLEVEFVPVEAYDISPDGEIVLEIHPEYAYLQKEDRYIDLDKPYVLEGLSIKQEEDIITFEDNDQLSYFQNIVKEQLNDTKNRERNQAGTSPN